MSEAGLGENLDLMPKPPASRVGMGDPNPAPHSPSSSESPESSLHSLQARGAYHRTAAGGDSVTGIGPPARRPLCRGYKRNIVWLPVVHCRAGSRPSGCACGGSVLHHGGGGRPPRTWYVRRGQAQPGLYNRVGPRPGLGRRGAKEQDRGCGGPTPSSRQLIASLATSFDLSHTERSRL